MGKQITIYNFTISPEQEDGFEKIKDAVSKAPVLKYFSKSDPNEG